MMFRQTSCFRLSINIPKSVLGEPRACFGIDTTAQLRGLGCNQSQEESADKAVGITSNPRCNMRQGHPAQSWGMSWLCK